MKHGFRDRMGGLHTWAGLVLSALLFAIFWTGTLSVFDKEIDRWMMPESRISVDASTPRLSVDRDILPLLPDLSQGATAWTIGFPSERSPFLSLAYDSSASHIAARKRFHPVTLEPLPAAQTRGASNFLYPFHHNLTMRQNGIGAWLVGIASMGMLCLLISGVVIHRKIFAEFFTLRILRRFGRANLDVHNLSGVVLLPFTLVITLSGLIVAHLIYFPKAPDAIHEGAGKPAAGVYVVADESDGQAAGAAPRERAGREGRPGAERQAGARQASRGGEGAALPATAPGREGSRNSPARQLFISQGQGKLKPPRGGQPADIVSMDGLIAQAERDFGLGAVSSIRVNNPGDTGGVAAIRRTNADTVTERSDNQRFSLATGERLPSVLETPTKNVWSFIGGMHYVHFSHWPLRWLYFLGGLGACVMIATGLMHWTQARNKGSRGSRLNVGLMNAMSAGAVTGLIAATGAFFLANRFLDGRAQWQGMASREIEVNVFFGIWALCALHAVAMALWRRRDGYLGAWAQQCWLIAALALAAMGLNWLTTGDHLLKTVFTDPYWPVAGMDLSLLATAGLAAWAARKLGAARNELLRELAEEQEDDDRLAGEAAHV